MGDEYFNTGPTALYDNLVVLTLGLVAAEVSADFDRCWASEAVHAIGPILGPPPLGSLIVQAMDQLRRDQQIVEYRGDEDLEWTPVLLVNADQPEARALFCTSTYWPQD